LRGFIIKLYRKSEPRQMGRRDDWLVTWQFPEQMRVLSFGRREGKKTQHKQGVNGTHCHYMSTKVRKVEMETDWEMLVVAALMPESASRLWHFGRGVGME
jgi:hypothetical protein